MATLVALSPLVPRHTQRWPLWQAGDKLHLSCMSRSWSRRRCNHGHCTF